MTQRTMLTVAAATTAFVLVVAGALIGRLTAGEPLAEAAAATPASVATATTADFATREAAYRAAIAEANRRLELANQQLAQQATPTSAPTAAAEYAVSPEQAQALALAAVPGAVLLRPAELVRYQGAPAYEVALDRGVLYIDAQAGTLLANGAAASPAGTTGGPVTAEQAAQAAQAYRGGGEVREVEREHERGGTIYAVKFSDGGTVYVDAANGQVVYARLEGYAHDEGEHGEHAHDD